MCPSSLFESREPFLTRIDDLREDLFELSREREIANRRLLQIDTERPQSLGGDLFSSAENSDRCSSKSSIFV